MRKESDWRVASDEVAAPMETRAQRIDFVIQRQTGIPSVYYLESLTEEERDVLLTDDDREERNVRFESLASMPEAEFERLYENERRELQRELDLYCAPADDITLRDWARKEVWYPAEALSLWFGFAPRTSVNLAAWARRNYGLTKAAAEIIKRQELLERAFWVGVLVEPLSPTSFIKWAMLKDLRLPDALVAEPGSTVPTGMPGQEHEGTNHEVKALRRQIEHLTARLEEVNKPYYQMSVKLFAALCVDIYGFRPDGKRNAATRIIRDILKDYWNAKDPKTVLGYIRSAVATLPEADKKLAKLRHDPLMEEKIEPLP
ncbi:hypothetical protein [Methylobacterium sp. JK268]